MLWPEFDVNGDLPVGVHAAALNEVIATFGTHTPQRRIIGRRLDRIYRLALSTGHLFRFVIFGSFVTSKPEPADVDIFLMMDDGFEVGEVTGEAGVIFDHMAAQNYEGASIFWIRRLAAIDGHEEAVKYWQIKRDGTQRGIV